MNRRHHPLFGSKAETLERIRALELTATIPSFVYISWSQWKDHADTELDSLSEIFKTKLLAVRSSAIAEDGRDVSFAGAYRSHLDVDVANRAELRESIESVFSSYPDTVAENQVLIQEMVNNIDVSGVILTRCLDDGSPYYVLSYDDESGMSDMVTSGRGSQKTVMVYRGYKDEYCDSPRIVQMMHLVKELELHFLEVPLDIEFALDKDGHMHLLQVRRITTVREWHPDTEFRVKRVLPCVEEYFVALSARKNQLYGDFTVLGNMPDWNPAEIIGVLPLPLATSLYRCLITSHIWSDARMASGYRRIPRAELMVLIAGHPYIDVRASFNSFVPSGCPEGISEKLVNAWLRLLQDKPVLHDKVEFEIVHTALDFTFDQTFKERYASILTSSEFIQYKNALRRLTSDALDISKSGSLWHSEQRIRALAERQDEGGLVFRGSGPMALGTHIGALLADCSENGTLPFSVIARHAFIAEALLRSAVSRGAISAERIAAFKGSVETVMSQLAADTELLSRGKMALEQYFERHGHLRPGTYDILSPCYRDRSDLFSDFKTVATVSKTKTFVLSGKENKQIQLLLDEIGLGHISTEVLLQYARRAIEGREYAKYVFTRNLSASLEAIADWGAYFNLGREDLAYLRIEDILDCSYRSPFVDTTSELMRVVDQARIDYSLAKLVKLSYLIRGVKDLHIVPLHRSQPNYITQKSVSGTLVLLQTAAMDYGMLQDKIVCIENADPGFDWIFTRGIAGLITKYGGSNSHMAIRCAEMQLPAAIGCGEALFGRLKASHRIELDCSAEMIRLLDTHV